MYSIAQLYLCLDHKGSRLHFKPLKSNNLKFQSWFMSNSWGAIVTVQYLEEHKNPQAVRTALRDWQSTCRSRWLHPLTCRTTWVGIAVAMTIAQLLSKASPSAVRCEVPRLCRSAKIAAIFWLVSELNSWSFCFNSFLLPFRCLDKWLPSLGRRSATMFACYWKACLFYTHWKTLLIVVLLSFNLSLHKPPRQGHTTDVLFDELDLELVCWDLPSVSSCILSSIFSKFAWLDSLSAATHCLIAPIAAWLQILLRELEYLFTSCLSISLPESLRKQKIILGTGQKYSRKQEEHERATILSPLSRRSYPADASWVTPMNTLSSRCSASEGSKPCKTLCKSRL